jgi:hypothetical protein
MAERSYEIYCNISDALDELAIVNAGKAEPPRYRACLNVFRCAGDGMHLFDDLVKVIGWRDNDTYEQNDESFPSIKLSEILQSDLVLFPDWDAEWKNRRRIAVSYRNMLAHHGRPWFNFENDRQYVGKPYVIRPQYCNSSQTWVKQRQLFSSPGDRGKFMPLFEACGQSPYPAKPG